MSLITPLTSQPRVCKQRVFNNQIMFPNPIFHVDGSFVKSGNLAGWAFILFRNRGDFLCAEHRAAAQTSSQETELQEVVHDHLFGKDYSLWGGVIFS